LAAVDDTAVSGGVRGRTNGWPAAATELPAAGCTRETAGRGRVDRRSSEGAVAPGAAGAGGVVQRLMIAGTWRCCVGGTLFGAPEGIPFPTSKARSQIWNEEITPATTRAIQITQENQLRIGGIIAVR
jgi:hypothetical protein